MSKNQKPVKPLTIEQFNYIIDTFEKWGIQRDNDYRMVLISHLLFRLVNLDDILNTINYDMLYSGKHYFSYNEQGYKKEKTIPIAGSKFLNALAMHYLNHKRVLYGKNLFYGLKSRKVLTAGAVRSKFLPFVQMKVLVQCSPISIRKCGALHMYFNDVSIKEISKILNHNTVEYTAKYLGIEIPKEKEKSNSIDCYNCLAI